MHSSILRTASRSFRAVRPQRRLIATSTVKNSAAASTASSEQLRDPDEPEILTEYPDVAAISRQYLPPTGWQDNQMRRNFGDPLHEQDELYSMWAPDIPDIDPNVALRRFGIAVLGFAGVFMFIKEFGTPEPHFVRRQYPYGGLTKALGGPDDNKARVDEESSEN